MMRHLAFWAAVLVMLNACPASAGAGGCVGTHERIEVNGVSLYYEVAGEGKPVVLVHASGGDHTNFAVLTGQLARAGYRVYALDSRGQGSNAPLKEYHYLDMAEDTYQFITGLGLEGAAYYGWSDGGIIGLLLEILHPGTLSLLAVSGANLSPEGVDSEHETVKLYAQLIESDPLVALLFREPHIEIESLGAIAVPVMVTAGEEDLVLRSHTQLIADSLPDAKLVIVEGHDHQSYIYDSEIIGELLLDFLGENGY